MIGDTHYRAGVETAPAANPQDGGAGQAVVASGSLDRRWGFMLGLGFIPIPKGPMLLEDPDRRPPFVVTLPSGATREIVEEPVGDGG